MQLAFEHVREIGAGQQPSAIHSADNHVQIFHTSAGDLKVMDAETPLGAWGESFGSPYLVCRDVDIEHMKLKYLSGTNIWVVWRNKAEASDVGYVEGDDRHRIAVFTLFQNVSKYLASGSLEFSQNNPIAQLVLELKNPNQAVSGEEEAVVIPGSAVALYFRSGDSARYPLGKYYIDRNQMAVTGATTSIEARNVIGKLLKDQTFDEDNEYTIQNFKTMLETMLDTFGVYTDNREVYTSANDLGMKFPAEMKALDGIQSAMAAVSEAGNVWQIKERMDGKVVLGPEWFAEFDANGTYTFERGTDVFSREVIRDDAEAYSRVCVKTSTNAVYRTVEAKFPLPAKKTLYVEVAEGTTLLDMGLHADVLAEKLAQVGVVETFAGPFRPHIQPGDGASIIDGGSQLLGVITTVRHVFGDGGYMTEFAVDSGGQVGKAQIGDYINKIAGRQISSSEVTRLY